MLEMIIGVVLGVVVGLFVYTGLALAIVLNPKFMNWYTNKIMAYFEQLTAINYEELKDEVKESE